MNSPEDALQHYKKTLDGLVTLGELRAEHKIQVNFGPGRSGVKDFKAIITLWESGKFFHGGGDGQIYTCLDHRLFERSNTTPPSALPIFRKMEKEGRTEWGCGNPIASDDNRGGVSLCKGCDSMTQSKHLTGQIPFYGSAQDLAELVAIIFRKLKNNADIYCKYDRTDIRYETQVNKKGAEEANRLRGLFIYPLSRIFTDTSNGSSVEKKFKEFFLA